VRSRVTSPFIALSSAAEPPHELHGSALPNPRPKLICRASSHQSAAGNRFKRHSEIANPTGVDTEVVFRHGKISFGYLDEILLGTQPTFSGNECGNNIAMANTMACPIFG
jgi:hypothetical protein